MQRIYLFFKQTITDFHLGCIVLSLVGFDLFIILSFVTVQGLRDHLTVYLVPSAENPKTHLGVSFDYEKLGLLVFAL